MKSLVFIRASTRSYCVNNKELVFPYQKFVFLGTSLQVQWLRLCSQYRGPQFDPCSGSWIPHAVIVCVMQLKILHATIKTRHTQINKSLFYFNILRFCFNFFYFVMLWILFYTFKSINVKRVHGFTRLLKWFVTQKS